MMEWYSDFDDHSHDGIPLIPVVTGSGIYCVILVCVWWTDWLILNVLIDDDVLVWYCYYCVGIYIVTFDDGIVDLDAIVIHFAHAHTTHWCYCYYCWLFYIYQWWCISGVVFTAPVDVTTWLRYDSPIYTHLPFSLGRCCWWLLLIICCGGDMILDWVMPLLIHYGILIRSHTHSHLWLHYGVGDSMIVRLVLTFWWCCYWTLHFWLDYGYLFVGSARSTTRLRCLHCIRTPFPPLITRIVHYARARAYTLPALRLCHCIHTCLPRCRFRTHRMRPTAPAPGPTCHSLHTRAPGVCLCQYLLHRHLTYHLERTNVSWRVPVCDVH